MRIYLDNCCFNRPFDEQTHFRVRIETEAKLYVQELIRSKEVDLVWSYVLDYENDANPFRDRREAVSSWKGLAKFDVDEEPRVVDLAVAFSRLGLKPRDALHMACAVVGSCDVFLTTDRGILAKRDRISEITILDPPAFIREMVE